MRRRKHDSAAPWHESQIFRLGCALLLVAGACLALVSCDSTTEPDDPEETYVLEGRVLSEDGIGIQDVSVELEREALTRSTTTDQDGRYSFLELEAGHYSLRVHPPSGMTGEHLDVPIQIPGGGGAHDFVLGPVVEAELEAPPGAADSVVLGSGVRAHLRNESTTETVRIEILDLSHEPDSAVPGARYPVRIRPLTGSGDTPAKAAPAEQEGRGILELLLPSDEDVAGMDVVMRLAEDLYEIAFPLQFDTGSTTDPATGEERLYFIFEMDPVDVVRPDDPVVIALEGADTECGSEAYGLAGPHNHSEVADRLPVILIHGWQATKRGCKDFTEQRFDVREWLAFYSKVIEGEPSLRDGLAVFTFRYPTFVEIPETAEILSALIQDRGWDEVAVLAHSRGGLVGRVTSAVIPDEQVRTLITLGTPHHGALIAEEQPRFRPVRDRAVTCGRWDQLLIGWEALAEQFILDDEGASHMTPTAVAALPDPSSMTRLSRLGSYISDVDEVEFSLLQYCLGHLWYEARGFESDGIVDIESALAAEWEGHTARFINLDHGHLREGLPEEDQDLRQEIEDALLAALFPIAIEITSPADGGTYQADEPIIFEGSAVTVEGTTLTDDALVWRSDQDGELGMGESITRSDLSVGIHDITLEATDQYGAVRSASVEIEVEAPPPPVATWTQVEGTVTGRDLLGAWTSGSTIVTVSLGGAILRSTDDGESWSTNETALNPRWGPGAVLWGNESTLVAVGHAGGLLRSRDRGATWSSVNSGTEKDLHTVWGAMSVIVAVGGDGTIIRSTDEGESWFPVTSGTTRDLHGVWGSGSTILAVGRDGTIVRSRDEGATWSPVSGATANNLNAVWGSGSIFLAGGDSGAIVRSTDGGATWLEVSGAPSSTLVLDIWGSGSTVVSVGWGEILHSTDGGVTWSRVRSRTENILFAVSGSPSSTIAVGQWGTMLRSPDGGENWTPITPGTTNNLAGISDSGFAMLAVGAGGTLRRSSDGGMTWLGLSSGSENSLGGVWGTGSTAVAVGSNGTILRSTDEGGTWTAITSGTANHLSDVWGNGSTILAVGNGGTILRSTNGGANWNSVTSGTTSPLTAVWGSDSTVLAVASGPGGLGSPGEILRSTDGGVTWSTVALDPTPELFGVWGSGSIFVAVGERGSILRSTDGGASWSRISSGTTRLLRGVSGAGSTIVTVGRSGTILRSTDGARTWQPLESGVDHWLIGVRMLDESNAVAVGYGGLILQGGS